MNWTQLLTGEIEANYRATQGLIGLVDDARLDWKPGQGANWMTTAQLIEHLGDACGVCCKAFVEDDWSFLTAPAPSSGTPVGTNEIGMVLAEGMPRATSKAAALARLAADKQVALAAVAKAGEAALATKMVPAPWNPTPKPLGQQLLDSVGHLGTHKAQLFYYLKLQGLPMHTGHLYGM